MKRLFNRLRTNLLRLFQQPVTMNVTITQPWEVTSTWTRVFNIKWSEFEKAYRISSQGMNDIIFRQGDEVKLHYKVDVNPPRSG